MSDVRISDDGYGLVLAIDAYTFQIGMPEANALQEQIRNALVASGCTMRQAVGYDDLGVAGRDAHVLAEALALLLGVKPTDVHSVEPTGYLVEVRQDCGAIVNRYSRKVELP